MTARVEHAIRVAFMLEELRLAAIYLNPIEAILTETESTARYLRQARHIMATIDRLIEEREFEPTREAEIVAERELAIQTHEQVLLKRCF
jgi:hypothetical protein